MTRGAFFVDEIHVLEFVFQCVVLFLKPFRASQASRPGVHLAQINNDVNGWLPKPESRGAIHQQTHDERLKCPTDAIFSVFPVLSGFGSFPIGQSTPSFLPA
jgi:hypothetical protein